MDKLDERELALCQKHEQLLVVWLLLNLVTANRSRKVTCDRLTGELQTAWNIPNWRPVSHFHYLKLARINWTSAVNILDLHLYKWQWSRAAIDVTLSCHRRDIPPGSLPITFQIQVTCRALKLTQERYNYIRRRRRRWELSVHRPLATGQSSRAKWCGQSCMTTNRPICHYSIGLMLRVGFTVKIV